MGKAEDQRVWFEKLYDRLHLPRWAGVVLIGCLPIALLFPASYAFTGLGTELETTGALASLPLLLVLVVILHLAASYVGSSMTKWKGYADSLLADGSQVDLSELFRARGPLTLILVFFVVIELVFVFLVLSKSHSVVQNVALTLPWLYWNIYTETFFWMFSYAMYKIYRVGRLPMKLKSFTEDRTLGLRPFGKVSLQLTAVYFAILLITLMAQTASVGTDNAGLGFIIFLTLLGLALFFVPQLSLHGKLVRAKQEANAWITPQHTRVMDKVRSGGVENADERVLSQLGGVESIRRDIAQIHTWPFDVGIVARLSAIVLSVVAILLSAIARNVLGI